MKLSIAGQALSEALDKPEDWDFFVSPCRIRHLPSGQEFWVGSGSLFFNGYDIECLGLIERHYLYYKYKRIGKMSKKEVKLKAATNLANALRGIKTL